MKDDVIDLLTMGGDGWDDIATDMVLILLPCERRKGRPVVGIITQYVLQKMLNRWDEQRRQKVQELYRIFSQRPETAPMAKWAFQEACREFLLKGGEFCLHQMNYRPIRDFQLNAIYDVPPNAMTRTLNLPPLEKAVFGNISPLTTLLSPRKYHRPLSDNNATYGSLVFQDDEVILFQYTQVSGYDAKAIGLDPIKENLPSNGKLVYVAAVPKGKNSGVAVPRVWAEDYQLQVYCLEIPVEEAADYSLPLSW